jgi:ribA/ribD-fused uncharacterized protein
VDKESKEMSTRDRYPSIEKFETDTHIFFWGDASPFSNFYQPITIETKINKFSSSEQLFMYIKALSFSDQKIAEAILKTNKPYMAKQLGREVEGFNEEHWAGIRYQAMLLACMEKFKQNEGVRKYMLSTGNKILVEASPYDKVWGIGLYPTDPLCLDEKNWKGENLLGKVLMEVRAYLAIIEDVK